MKKIFLVFNLLFFAYLHSQNTNLKFRGGIAFGLTVSDINGADTRDNDNDFSKLGLAGGFVVNTDLNKKNVLQMEMNYIQCGSLQRPDSMNNGYSNISLSYIEIPFVIRHHVKFSIRKKPVEKLDLEFGASYSRLLTQQAIGNNNYVIYGSRGFYNDNLASIILGANYTISRNFYFCVRYSNSVIPAIKRNALHLYNITYTLNKGNTMVFNLSFKYIFNGKKPETSTPRPEE